MISLRKKLVVAALISSGAICYAETIKYYNWDEPNDGASNQSITTKGAWRGYSDYAHVTSELPSTEIKRYVEILNFSKRLSPLGLNAQTTIATPARSLVFVNGKGCAQSLEAKERDVKQINFAYDPLRNLSQTGFLSIGEAEVGYIDLANIDGGINIITSSNFADLRHFNGHVPNRTLSLMVNYIQENKACQKSNIKKLREDDVDAKQINQDYGCTKDQMKKAGYSDEQLKDVDEGSSKFNEKLRKLILNGNVIEESGLSVAGEMSPNFGKNIFQYQAKEAAKRVSGCSGKAIPDDLSGLTSYNAVDLGKKITNPFDYYIVYDDSLNFAVAAGAKTFTSEIEGEDSDDSFHGIKTLEVQPYLEISAFKNFGPRLSGDISGEVSKDYLAGSIGVAKAFNFIDVSGRVKAVSHSGENVTPSSAQIGLVLPVSQDFGIKLMGSAELPFGSDAHYDNAYSGSLTFNIIPILAGIINQFSEEINASGVPVYNFKDLDMGINYTKYVNWGGQDIEVTTGTLGTLYRNRVGLKLNVSRVNSYNGSTYEYEEEYKVTANLSYNFSL